VPLIVAEPLTETVQALARRDPEIVVWWGTRVECVSAVAQLEREGVLDTQSAALSVDRLQQLAAGWHEIEPAELVRESAARFLRVHPLRAADAFQIAAAFVAANRRPASLEAVTLDGRLADAMRKEGFRLVEVATA
jgi:predicted nucleic acid-binding protein